DPLDQLPQQPDRRAGRAGVLREGGGVRPEERGDRGQRSGLQRDVLRGAAAVVSGDAGRARGRHRVPLAVEDLQHDGLAHRVGLRQRRPGRRPRPGEDQRRLGRVRRGPARGHRGADRRSSVRGAAARHLPRAARRSLRRARQGRLRRADAQGQLLHAGGEPQGDDLDRVRRAAARRGGRRRHAGHRVRRRRRGVRAPDGLRGQGAPGRGGRAAQGDEAVGAVTRPIAISLGDPAGIGPEIVVRALAERPDLEVVVFGDEGVLARAAKIVGVAGVAGVASPRARVYAATHLADDEVTPGRPNDVSGRAQLAYLTASVDAALAGEVAALVTAPISKEWIGRAGFKFPGHTEYLAARAGVSEFAMMLAGPRLRVTVATTHVPLAEVPRLLTSEGIASTIWLTAEGLARRFGIAAPRVAVAGLNPHAGEAGRFGDEEERLVKPAIEKARARLASAGLVATVDGPLVPDSVFRQAAGGAYDAVVALYHDQGLIPLKLLHFDDGVNLTLGLPFVRTSPDHGTAYDIAGTGRARAQSFLAAFDLARAMARPSVTESGRSVRR